MKKTVIFSLMFCLFFVFQTNAQYKFKDVKRLKTTSVKNQNRSGTCWSFSTLSFVESEMLRMGNPATDLSEMFVVRYCYSDKATKYVRLHGSLNFGGGGAGIDPIYVIDKYGIVPEEVYKGLEIGEESHVHGEMDEILKSYVDAVIKNKNKKLTPTWHKSFDNILDSYLGEIPKNFKYKGKEYTPKSFAKEYVKINPDDYVTISSFTHHDFYKSFVVEVPDNWLWAEAYNLPLNEMVEVMDNAIKTGYTFAWASDVSEDGFSFRNGVAIVPEDDLDKMEGTEREKWEKLTKREKMKQLYSFENPTKEKEITQEMRQKAFDNYKTTDDHGMHIIGIAKDQNGKEYYTVKNSWDTNNIYDGYFYASKAFVKYKTMSILLHKDALPKKIKDKLKL